MLPKFTNKKYLIASGAVTLLLAVKMCPGLSDYESYEMRRFKGNEKISSFKSFTCSQNELSQSPLSVYIEMSTYQSICEDTISNLEDNPDKLLALIRGDTKKTLDLGFFSGYDTKYYDVKKQISNRVEQHPAYRTPPSGGVNSITTSYPNGGFNLGVIGIFGVFIDFRGWSNF